MLTLENILQQLHDNSIATVRVADIRVRAEGTTEIGSVSERPLNMEETARLFRELRNNSSVVNLDLAGLNLDIGTSRALCILIRLKKLTTINVTGFKIAEPQKSNWEASLNSYTADGGVVVDSVISSVSGSAPISSTGMSSSISSTEIGQAQTLTGAPSSSAATVVDSQPSITSVAASTTSQSSSIGASTETSSVSSTPNSYSQVPPPTETSHSMSVSTVVQSQGSPGYGSQEMSLSSSATSSIPTQTATNIVSTPIEAIVYPEAHREIHIYQTTLPKPKGLAFDPPNAMLPTSFPVAPPMSSIQIQMPQPISTSILQTQLPQPVSSAVCSANSAAEPTETCFSRLFSCCFPSRPKQYPATQMMQMPIPAQPPIVSGDVQIILHQDSSYTIRYADLTVQEQLGSGAFGMVCRGRWQGTDVAIKKLQVAKFSTETLQALEDEARIMKSLSHPNIVQFFGFCSEESNYSLIMEYMPKKSLETFLHSNVLITWPQRWQIAVDISAGLSHLHNHVPPILHHDLKSANVLLSGEMRAKLSDFGLSKARDETRISTTTLPGQAFCSLLWSAPEIFTNPNNAYTAACDVFSLGLVFWELVVRQMPWKKEGHNELVPAWVTNGKRPEIPKDTPPPLAKLIAKCWAQRPEDRPVIGQIIGELEAHCVEIVGVRGKGEVVASHVCCL